MSLLHSDDLALVQGQVQSQNLGHYPAKLSKCSHKMFLRSKVQNNNVHFCILSVHNWI